MPRYNPLLPETTGPVLRFRVFGKLLGQTTETTFLFMPEDPNVPAPTLEVWATAFTSIYLDKYNSCVTLSWTGTILRTDRFDDPSIAFHDEDISGVAGDVVGNPTPSFVSMRLRRQTATAGQRGRGTIRLPGVTEENTVGNELTGVQKTALGELAEQLVADFNSANPLEGTYRHCIATRTTTLTPLPETVTRAAPVTVAIALSALGTSRSRLPRETI